MQNSGEGDNSLLFFNPNLKFTAIVGRVLKYNLKLIDKKELV